jgi:hypothetical protein
MWVLRLKIYHYSAELDILLGYNFHKMLFIQRIVEIQIILTVDQV